MKAINYKYITVSRPGVGDTATTIKASPGYTEVEELTNSSLVLQARYQDWIIDKADYVLGGNLLLPKNGDVIVWGAKEYRVVTPDGKKAPFDYVTVSELRLRVHTVQVGD